MPNHKLSLIIPCYNCSSTLEESFNSFYTQNLKTDYEIIMVDDGSSDETRELIISLSKRDKNIRYFFHDVNRGGGAARNTGIEKAAGDLIYCFDSDNIFAPDSLQKMIDFLDEKKCDGVAFYERRFFLNNHQKRFKSQFNNILDRAVRLDDLFNDSGIMLDNFLFTKESYLKSGGYPENNNFDTQCFEVRYLAAGFKIHFCPEVSFYHRQFWGGKSYFERAYESGEFSRNFYLIYEDIIHLFSPQIRKEIFSFDIFSSNSLGLNSLLGRLSALYRESPDSFFIEDYQQYLYPNSMNDYGALVSGSDKVEDLFCLAILARKNSDFNLANDYYQQIIASGFSNNIIIFNIIRNAIAGSGAYTADYVDRNFDKIIRPLILREMVVGVRQNSHFALLKKMILKIPGVSFVWGIIKKILRNGSV
jgi:glycosyltransferase involved in cell wall biosynthesis